MNYRSFQITKKPNVETRILLIYTGGTLGMYFDTEKEVLLPMNYEELLVHLPSLNLIEASVDLVELDKIIDSSNVGPENWSLWAKLVDEQYDSYEGFVFLHGTDTMAYSASAMSFMLEGLNKPVIFTGAQLPLNALRSDANRNILTSLELTLAKGDTGEPMIQETCIFFDDVLLRGNRTTKIESNDFDAFESKNYPELVRTGVSVEFNESALYKSNSIKRSIKTLLNSKEVGTVKLYPGIPVENLKRLFDIGTTKVVILETFGSGNAPTSSEFLETVSDYIKSGGIVVNISQCAGGGVLARKYETNALLTDLGVINGSDLTFEAAITKAMYVLGNYPEDVASKMGENMRGELSL